MSRAIYRTRNLFCWRCAYKQYEWMGLRKAWQDRLCCFYCRIDALDRRYGPSECAEMWKNVYGGRYLTPTVKTRYERRLTELRAFRWVKQKT